MLCNADAERVEMVWRFRTRPLGVPDLSFHEPWGGTSTIFGPRSGQPTSPFIRYPWRPSSATTSASPHWASQLTWHRCRRNALATPDDSASTSSSGFRSKTAPLVHGVGSRRLGHRDRMAVFAKTIDHFGDWLATHARTIDVLPRRVSEGHGRREDAIRRGADVPGWAPHGASAR